MNEHPIPTSPLLTKLVRPLREFFIEPEEYRQRILKQLSQIRSNGGLSCEDLLTLHRLDDVQTWNVSSVLSKIVPHRMELRTQSGVSVVVWGFRSEGNRVVSYVSASGCLLELDSSDAGCVVRSGGRELFNGGNVLADSFEINFGERKLVVVAPRSRPEWNSAWQKVSHVVIQESGKEYCRLILQPFSGSNRVVDYVAPDSIALAEDQLLALISLSVVLNARFVA
jgi:hypothetical protein